MTHPVYQRVVALLCAWLLLPCVGLETIVLTSKVVASDGAAGDELGYYVSVSSNGSLIGTGAPLSDAETGSAYSFVPSETGWVQQQKITASSGASSGDLFGLIVVMSSDGMYLAVSAPHDDVNIGSVYVYVRTGSSWTFQQWLKSSDRAVGDYFGRFLAISATGTYLAAAAPLDDETYPEQGSVYIFTRSGSTWSYQTKLTLALNYGYFGYDVTFSADATYLGVYSRYGAGFVTLFTRSGATWSQQAQLTVSGASEFGRSIALSADASTIAVASATALYIFDRSGVTWTQAAHFAWTTLPTPYGVSISADGSYVIAALYANEETYHAQGSAFAFYRYQSIWIECAKILSDGGKESGYFGYSAAMSADGAVVAIGATHEGSNGQGAVYIQSLCPPGRFLENGACASCEAGKYSASVGATSRSTCIPCGAGTFGDAEGAIAASMCVECGVGKFSNVTGSSSCSDCPQGTYGISAGQTSCTECDPGKYSSTDAASSPSDCKSCPAGTYSSQSGAAICSSCQPGRFSSATGAANITTCDACPAGTSSYQTGATTEAACQACMPGKYSEQGQSSCSSCSAGRYNPEYGATSASSCVACPVGWYSTVEAAKSAVSCNRCPTNTFASVAGQAVCTDCPYGTCTKGQNGQSTCESCSNYLAITQVTGCSPCTTNVSSSICDAGNGIYDCPTEGGVQIDVYVAEGLLDGYSATNLTVSVDVHACTITDVGAHEGKISCLLPPGVGSTLQITVAETVTGLMGSANWLSYAAPTIHSVHGCANTEPLPHANGTSACDRSGGDVVTIMGANFGPAQADVLVGGKQATIESLLQFGYAGWEHNTTVVQIPAGSGLFIGVNVLQSNGALSDSAPMVSYKQCEPGTFNSPTVSGTFECDTCPQGSYSSQPEAYYCAPCTAGFYCNATHEIACPFEYAISPSGSSSVSDCTCRNNLALVGGACVCPPGSTLNTGGVICEECSIGMFKSGWDLEACEPCPAMMTTNTTGTSSVDMCVCNVEIGAESDAVDKSCACAAGFGYSPEFGCQVCSTNYYAPIPSIDPCRSCKDIDSIAVSVNESGSTGCECPTGFFMDNIESATHFTCEECSAGMHCVEGGQTLQTLQLRSGYWRSTSSSHRIRKCVLSAACPNHANDAHCEDHQEGVLCAVCADDYAAYSSYSLCVACEQHLISGFATLGVIVSVAAVILIAYHKVDWFADTVRSTWMAVQQSRTVRVNLKVLFVYCQLMAGFGRVLEADYPSSVNNFFAWLSVLNFSPSGMLSCLFGDSFNFFSELLFLTLLPLGIALVVVLHTAWKFYCDESNNIKKWLNILLERILLVCFLFFSPVSTIVLEAFNCDSNFDGGESYLRADYSISCATSTYAAYRAYATAMLFVYPIGIPLFCFVLLCSQRNLIHVRDTQPTAGDQKRGGGTVSKCIADVVLIRDCQANVSTDLNRTAVDSLSAHTHRVWQLMRALEDEELSGMISLFEAYRPELWFFEVVEMSRRLLLSGLLVFMYPGTDKQLILAVLLCAYFMALYTFLNPFLSQDHNVFLRAAQWGLFCQLFGTLMLQQETFTGYRLLVGALIVVSGVVVPLIGILSQRRIRAQLKAYLWMIFAKPKGGTFKAWQRMEEKGGQSKSTEFL